MLYFGKGDVDSVLTDKDLRDGLFEVLNKLEIQIGLQKALIVPPDFTRFHSKAGILTSYAYEYLGNKLTDILTAL